MRPKVQIRVLIVDDYAVVREGLRAIINAEPDMRVIAEARNGQEAIDMYGQHHPDVTLMDLRMPIMKGVEAIEIIRKEFPHSRIIVLTGSGADEDIYRSLKARVQSYLWKSMSREQLLKAIRTVNSGGRLIPAPIARRFAERALESDLTNRELEVLELITNGKSNKRIAIALGISESTVKKHVVNLMSKLGADDRTQAATKGLKSGIIHFE